MHIVCFVNSQSIINGGPWQTGSVMHQPMMLAAANITLSLNELLEHCCLLYSGELESYVSEARPLVNLIQRLLHVCQVLQMEAALLKAERDLFHKWYSTLKQQIHMLEKSHPSNPDNLKGEESLMQDKIEIVHTNFSIGCHNCNINQLLPQITTTHASNKRPSQGGVGRETTVQQYLGKKQCRSPCQYEAPVEEQITITLASSPGTGLSECTALQQPQPPTPLPPACIGVKEIKT